MTGKKLHTLTQKPKVAVEFTRKEMQCLGQGKIKRELQTKERVWATKGCGFYN